MIRTQGLTKRFGRITAVEDLALEVAEGDVYGFLGANGSGKTTTVRMLLGLVLATAGSMEVLGRPIPRATASVLPDVGAMIEGPAAYPQLSGRANLRLFDAIRTGSRRAGRRRRVDDALEQVGLGGVDNRPARAYSLGMRQRLGLASALLHRPRLLVLDEPTNGLDPQGIREIRQLLLDLNRAGTTVFMSSHLLAEIEQSCNRVGVLDRGRLVLQDEIANLDRPTGRTVLRTPDVSRARGLLNAQVQEAHGDRLVVRVDDVADLNSRLVGAGVRVTEIAAERQRLEDVILSVTSPGSDQVRPEAAPA